MEIRLILGDIDIRAILITAALSWIEFHPYYAKHNLELETIFEWLGPVSDPRADYRHMAVLPKKIPEEDISF